MTTSNTAILACHEHIKRILALAGQVIVGQRYLMERLLMGLLVDGHILVEGVPGLAKTTAVKTLAQIVGLRFQRIQFTPDLLPADILGTQIYDPRTQEFTVKKGPLFHQLILADEINRAPAKVQSALLEAMQEKQVTIGQKTFALEEPFVVMATQNPIEQEGTYPLPEAQVDRFMLKLKVTYPSPEEERQILKRANEAYPPTLSPVLASQDILAVRNLLREIHVDSKIHNYIVQLVGSTRQNNFDKIKGQIHFGASPRATIYLDRAARALALFEGRDYVVPQDVKTMAPDVLRHRLLLSYEAEAEGLTTDDVITTLLMHVEVP